MPAALGAGGLLIAAAGLAEDGSANVAMSVVGLTIGVVGFTTAGITLLLEDTPPKPPSRSPRVGVGAGSVLVRGAF